MELTWSTFILEIVNFLVLVWLLQRFLYKPVAAVIARRREAIGKQLADAKALHEEAEASRARYENRLQEWQREREQSLRDLDREIEAERGKRLEVVAREVAEQEQKARALREHRDAESARHLQQEALENAAGFAARLLQQAAGPELERRLVELAIEQLGGLSGAQVEELRSGHGMGGAAIVVSSAWPLDDAQREAVVGALAQLLPDSGECRFEQHPELLAGLCIILGGWRLGLNLRDELRGFTRMGAAS